MTQQPERIAPGELPPWAFIGMGGMAPVAFAYLYSPKLAPWYVCVLLWVLWVALFVQATRWWTPHPKRVLLVPVVAGVLWFAVLVLGARWFDWQPWF